MPLEPGVRETPLLQRAQLEVINQHVGLCDQVGENLLPRGYRHVERQRTFVTVDAKEIDGVAGEKGRPPGAGVVAGFGRLDLDHIGAHVAEDHGAKGTCQDAGQIDDAQSGERAIVAHIIISCAWRAAR